MLSVHEYRLYPGEHEYAFPDGARILNVGVRDGQSFMWALVDPNAKPTPRRILVVGTDHEIDRDPAYVHFIGAIHMVANLGLVFHVFEMAAPRPAHT